MKRSQVNDALQKAEAFFQSNGWMLPPEAAWDITDFGLGQFEKEGLAVVNLADEAEYCEKLMYATKDQRTPAHCHLHKKEDIICRHGVLIVQVWPDKPDDADFPLSFQIQVNNKARTVQSGEKLRLTSGERITLNPGIYHSFYPESEGCIIGELSNTNDIADIIFPNPAITWSSKIEEDAPPLLKLVHELNEDVA